VLVVDDSAVVRQSMAEILSREPGITVETAADPLIARDKMARARPSVIVLDLELPRQHGLAFLKELMADDPMPVVVCSGLAARGTEAALRAVEEGAVEVVAKPQFDVRGFLLESRSLLVDAIRGAAEARIRPRGPLRRTPSPSARAPRAGAGPDLVAIGASTGGTEAIRLVLEALPADAPGTVIVQHMPEVFTRTFADRLDRSCAVHVREARHGDFVRRGVALVAPGNRHLQVRRQGAGYAVEILDGPLVSRHRPSVDVLFHSVAEAAGRRAVGLILTGMGGDGAEGLLAMHRAGAVTFAQDEATSVVFGMPREAIRAGAVSEVLPLDRIPAALMGAA
jgi:two-component system chemotaxis response regulator CheB